jgi:hypothetical protein
MVRPVHWSISLSDTRYYSGGRDRQLSTRSGYSGRYSNPTSSYEAEVQSNAARRNNPGSNTRKLSQLVTWLSFGTAPYAKLLFGG